VRACEVGARPKPGAVSWHGERLDKVERQLEVMAAQVAELVELRHALLPATEACEPADEGPPPPPATRCPATNHPAGRCIYPPGHAEGHRGETGIYFGTCHGCGQPGGGTGCQCG
jgi:hypothetical protein